MLLAGIFYAITEKVELASDVLWDVLAASAHFLAFMGVVFL
jgi:hypothetical protein